MGDIASPSRSRWGHKRSLQLVQSGGSSGGDRGRRAPFLSHASCPTAGGSGHSGSHGMGWGWGWGAGQGSGQTQGKGSRGPALQPADFCPSESNPPPPPPPHLPHPALPGNQGQMGLTEKASRETAPGGQDFWGIKTKCGTSHTLWAMLQDPPLLVGWAEDAVSPSALLGLLLWSHKTSLWGGTGPPLAPEFMKRFLGE